MYQLDPITIKMRPPEMKDGEKITTAIPFV